MKQLMNPANYINTEAFLSAKLTQTDVVNHCYILQSLVQAQKTPQQVHFCMERLFEYVFCETYKFRSHPVFEAIAIISGTWTLANPTFHSFLKIMLSKQVSIFASLSKLQKDDTGTTICWRNLKDIQHRIRNAVGIVLRNVLKSVKKESADGAEVAAIAEVCD